MKKTIITSIITVLLVEVLAFATAFGPGEFDKGGFGIVNGIFTLLTFLIGLISIGVGRTGDVGKGILLASGILLIIGISVCSIGPLSV